MLLKIVLKYILHFQLQLTASPRLPFGLSHCSALSKKFHLVVTQKIIFCNFINLMKCTK
uniref:Uncharacterized protein n=1 Tax=Setaria italica TaxID=4555 RepID=K3YKQ6_SETIT